MLTHVESFTKWSLDDPFPVLLPYSHLLFPCAAERRFRFKGWSYGHDVSPPLGFGAKPMLPTLFNASRRYMILSLRWWLSGWTDQHAGVTGSMRVSWQTCSSQHFGTSTSQMTKQAIRCADQTRVTSISLTATRAQLETLAHDDVR